MAEDQNKTAAALEFKIKKLEAELEHRRDWSIATEGDLEHHRAVSMRKHIK